MQKLPSLSVDLIKQLDKDYPPILPNDDITDKALWGKIYQRRLVENLLSLVKEPTIYPED